MTNLDCNSNDGSNGSVTSSHASINSKLPIHNSWTVKIFVKREQFTIIGEINFVKREQFVIICDFDLMKQAAATGVEATTVVNYSKEQVTNCIMVVMMPMGDIAVLTFYQWPG